MVCCGGCCVVLVWCGEVWWLVRGVVVVVWCGGCCVVWWLLCSGFGVFVLL